MSNQFHLPPTGFGPGSQPPAEDGAELIYTPMPQDMRTWSPHIPEVKGADTSAAFDLLRQIADAAEAQPREGARFDLSQLDAASRALMAETLGEGEVSVRIRAIPAIAAQESVFAGVWVLSGAGTDVVEVAPVPSAARSQAFAPVEKAKGAGAPRGPGVLNAPPLFAELADKSASYTEGQAPHIVNLTLLPHTAEDLDWLEAALGTGSVDILSRGYGNCRVTATALPHVWKVRYYNSMDTLILDTYEVTAMPEVALAAPEDLTDSASRIREVLEAIS